MHVLVSCKNEENLNKNEDATLLPFKVYRIFLDAQGQVTPQSFVKCGRHSNSSEIL